MGKQAFECFGYIFCNKIKMESGKIKVHGNSDLIGNIGKMT